jgi:high-affinity iron transporter
VIGLREGLETVVIVGAIVVFLRIQNRGDLVRSVWKASAIAAAICIVLAVVLRVVEAGLPLRPQQGLQTIISVSAVLMVTYMIVWMRAFPKDHLSDSRNAAAAAIDGNAGQALVLMAFFAVLREGIEISVFVIATLGITGGNGWLAALGVIIGIAVALIIGVGVVRGSRHLNTAMFFRVSAVILVVCAAGIAMSAMHSALGAGWLTAGQRPLLDLSWLAPTGSVLSSITIGMFGIQPHPGAVEIAVWIAYFVTMMTVVLIPRWPGRAAAGQGSPVLEETPKAAWWLAGGSEVTPSLLGHDAVRPQSAVSILAPVRSGDDHGGTPRPPWSDPI